MLLSARNKISRQLKGRSWIFVLLLIFFASGVTVGCNNFNLTEETGSDIITYFSGKAEFNSIVYDSFFKSFKLMMWIFASGLSLVGIPLILYFIFTKGVSLGAAVCALISVSSEQPLTVILCLLPHIIFLVIAMMLSCYKSFVFSGALFRNVFGFKKYRNTSWDSFFSLAVTFLISALLCYLSALCEGFFIPHM